MSQHLHEMLRRKPNYVHDHFKKLETEDGQCRQTFRGGNKDNYVRHHLKKLEAQGRCCMCAEKIGSQGEEAHKKSCKAIGTMCN